MKEMIDNASYLERKIKSHMEQGEKLASLELMYEMNELLLTSLSSLQQEKQRENETKIQSFINDRLNDIKNGKTPIGLNNKTLAVVHLLPLNFFESKGNALDMSFFVNRGYSLSLLSGTGRDSRYNYDGYLSYNSYNGSYLQVYRNGCIEIVDSSFFHEENKWLFPVRYEKALIENLPIYLQVLNQWNGCQQYLVCGSFLGVKDYSLYLQNSYFYNTLLIERDELYLPQILIDNEVNIAVVLKPAFDVIWNSAGFTCSHSYIEGKWNPRN